jgi:hypothetical protein
VQIFEHNPHINVQIMFSHIFSMRVTSGNAAEKVSCVQSLVSAAHHAEGA